MDHREQPLTRAVLEHRGVLYGFIYALVRDVGMAEEVFQEVAVVAIQKDQKRDEVIQEPAKWLREVARRLIQAGFRARSGRMVEVSAEYLEQVAVSFDAVSDRNERRAALIECLKSVSAEHREILRKRYVLGMKYEEMAAVLQRSAGALRVLVHRVQSQLTSCVQARLAEQEVRHDG